MQVIELLSGPGAGKSTIAAGLFNLMKVMGHEVELITEVAKDMTWENRIAALENQLYILAKQEWRQHRLEGKVDYVITDSSLLLGLLYTTPRYETEWFRKAVHGAWGMYDNLTFFIERGHPFKTKGRNQNEEEAKRIDRRTKGLLGDLGVPYQSVRATLKAPSIIYKAIRESQNVPNHPPGPTG